ncbi:CDP-alcohol phosphatidyltransferase family protein [Candidatus Binatus sp.]|uniref:CDP-alcohol phosphatidyltransferase family protein n=1 Tax=Candidatus Binatus sp. TaxID=2811406 RepID=UPI003C688A8F
MAAPSHSSIRARQTTQPAAASYSKLLNLPNFLTLCRLASIPIFLTFLTRQRYTAALYIFAAAALTDGLDGAVARWFDSRTELGAFLDPFADKLMLVSAFVVLTIDGDLPGYLLSVVLIRDIVIVVGYLMISFFTGERVPVRPSYLGKLSTFMQLACVIAVLARAGNYWPGYFNALLISTVAVTAASFVHYMYRGLVWLRSREPEMFA